MLTVVVGRSSNLSEGLAAAIPDCQLVSARALTRERLAATVPRSNFRVVVNSFQPASRLRDLSDPVGYVDLSLGVTARVLETVAGRGCAKVVYTSSASVYGNSVSCRETDRSRAGDLHSGLKVANEHLVREFCEREGIDCTIVRLFNMYGGRDGFSVVAKVLAAVRTKAALSIVNDGNAVRDFVHIDDVVALCLAAATNDHPHRVLNAGSGQATQLRALVSTLAANCGRDIPVRYQQPPPGTRGGNRKPDAGRRAQAVPRGRRLSSPHAHAEEIPRHRSTRRGPPPAPSRAAAVRDQACGRGCHGRARRCYPAPVGGGRS